MDNCKLVGESRQRSFLRWTAAAVAGESGHFLTTVVTACAAFLFAVLSVPAFGQAPVGLVGGVTRDPGSGKPVAAAQIVAHNMDKGTDSAAVTDADGIFTFTKLEPGRYEFVATKDGFQKSSAQAEVAAGRTTRVELPLQPGTDLHAAAEASDNAALTALVKQLLQRIDGLEERLAATETVATEAKDASSARDTPKPALSTRPLVASLAPIPAGPPAAPLPPALPALPPASPAPVPPQAAAAAPAPPAPSVPAALQPPDPPPAVDNVTPFAFGDFTWMNGTTRTKDTVLDTKFFTPEFRADTHYMEDFNQPIDHTIVGATESFRSGEVQIEQISVGGDFHWDNVRGRVLYMDGLFSTTTPRNDASSATGSDPGNNGSPGQWDLQGAYKYVSEAYGGYHFNVNHGLNVDAGIFVSYIGLFSYYNFDNWTYQPSYVSSNTPWFFNGVRVQWYPTNKLKIEPWFINGWQSYAKYNGHPGLGGQLLWMPKEWFKLVANQYGYGQDNLGLPHTERIHTDDSILVRYYNNPESTGLSKMAFSLTADAGSQYGGGLCGTCAPSKNKESFVGWMLYDRMWFHKDLLGLTLGGGEMSNWGRYLTLLPPIDGAWAAVGSPYFTELPGQRAHMWDSTVTLQYMPKQYITWWIEAGYRHSDVPYFAGRGGVTPPGGNNGLPQYYTCMTGASAGTSNLASAQAACGGASSVWFPDLRRSETKLSAGVMVKF
jgi:hypothetical protein